MLRNSCSGLFRKWIDLGIIRFINNIELKLCLLYSAMDFLGWKGCLLVWTTYNENCNYLQGQHRVKMVCTSYNEMHNNYIYIKWNKACDYVSSKNMMNLIFVQTSYQILTNIQIRYRCLPDNFSDKKFSLYLSH